MRRLPEIIGPQTERATLEETAASTADDVTPKKIVANTNDPSLSKHEIDKPTQKATFFRNKTINGKTYDLSHLNPFEFTTEGSGNNFRIRVIFGCHCFTEAVKDHHTPDLRYNHKGEERSFCVIRHNLSLSLPRMITTLGSQTVYMNNRGNFFFWRDQTVTGVVTPYLVFFDTIRGRKDGVDVVMNIESAHLKPGMTQSASAVRFSTLIEAKATGKRLKPGPMVQIKRK